MQQTNARAKKSIKNALKGSKVKTVKVQVQQLKSTKGLKGKALNSILPHHSWAQFHLQEGFL